MAFYPFQCKSCTVLDTEGQSVPFEFTLQMAISNYTAHPPCPSCSQSDTARIFTAPSIHMESGLTASEKRAGTTRTRKDMGRYMKDVREKRKREFSPQSKEGLSNELWVGNEVQRGVYNTTPKK